MISPVSAAGVPALSSVRPDAAAVQAAAQHAAPERMDSATISPEALALLAQELPGGT